MAEMLIDGAKLDACLDAEADAIRAKTGGSSDIPFDFANNKGFADAIASIQTGGGADISPFKFVKGTITPSENTKSLIFPCGDISTVVFCEAKVVNYESYISADNNGMGLGRVHFNFRPYFDNRTFNGSFGGFVLSVYNGAFDYWNAPNVPTIDSTNQTATFAGNSNVTFKAGIPIEYIMLGV